MSGEDGGVKWLRQVPGDCWPHLPPSANPFAENPRTPFFPGMPLAHFFMSPGADRPLLSQVGSSANDWVFAVAAEPSSGALIAGGVTKGLRSRLVDERSEVGRNIFPGRTQAVLLIKHVQCTRGVFACIVAVA